ncbi:ferritin-like protein [Kitasatospora sp. NPDC096077]|uniref:ferritin-like domain-containing protein n=1 Tax=Kitasatospora sp. NPDC096077 TaxID=3155544 RepID=UPI00331E697A
MTATAKIDETLVPDFLTGTATRVNAAEPITTRDELIRHLKQAARLELLAVPMYLYPSFSIASRGYSQWDPGMGAFRLIRSVVVEEMLHLCLVRNLLVALGEGDKVKFNDRDFMPTFPMYMPHRWPPLQLHLGPCSRELVRDVFMEFEKPAPKGSQQPMEPGWYPSIGKFYEAVGEGLKFLDSELPDLWKSNQPDLQYVAAYWNKDGGGEPVLIKDLKTAQDALKIIVDQGEGTKDDRLTVPIDPLKPVPGLDEMPHYIKFKRIGDGIEPIGPVWPLPTDPQAKLYADDPAVTSLNTLFNAMYCYVLHMIDLLYHTSRSDVRPGVQSPRYHYERTFVSAMQGILVSVAELMAATQVTVPQPMVLHAGPTFEYHRLPGAGKNKQHLMKLCDAAMAHFPQLGGDNSVRWLISHLPDGV